MVQVTCINKDGGNHYNRHEGITNFGWTDPQTGKRGNSSRADMIAFLDGKGHAYTKDAYGREAKLYVVRPTGRAAYVQTYADNQWTDNLLALSECRL